MKSLQYTSTEGDTGSIEAQVAVLTWEIQPLERTPQTAPKKDHAAHRGLMKIGRRRNLLAYLRTNDVDPNFRELINSLGLRR